MNWNPFKALTALESRINKMEVQVLASLESRIKKLEVRVLELHMRLVEKDQSEKALAVLRKARQREYGRRYYEKKKAMKAKA